MTMTCQSNLTSRIARLVAMAIALLCSGTGMAQVPAEMQGVGVNERLDEMLPLDLEFTDHEGNTVTLGEYFHNDKPVILTPVFYECPMLCSLILNGLVDGLNRVEDWNAGDEFEIVTFSFNPEESYKLAGLKRKAYFTQYVHETTEGGWPFLTGTQENIKALTDALGYYYKYDPKQETYAHSASIMFITPDGRISRYMNDVLFQPKDLRYALIESSEGRIGSPMEKFLLYTCYTYDPESGSYVASAWKVMRLGGVLTILVIAGGIIWLTSRGSKSPPQKKDTVLMGGMQT
ncbi:MAG: SCO family protein [Planctomycetota bacterium]|nr:SCO family protein [Planctomycetota bacterium]